MNEEDFDDFLQDACMKLHDMWVAAGGWSMSQDAPVALNDALTQFFGDIWRLLKGRTMGRKDLQLVLVRYGSDTGLISLTARDIICHTMEDGDGGLEWPKGIPVVDFCDESVFTRLLGQNLDEPDHNWEDVLAYVLAHVGELGLADHSVAIDPHTRVVTMQVSCMAQDAEDVKRSLFDEKGRCWYLDHSCPLGPIQVEIRLPTAIEEVAARDALGADETVPEAGHV